MQTFIIGGGKGITLGVWLGPPGTAPTPRRRMPSRWRGRVAKVPHGGDRQYTGKAAVEWPNGRGKGADVLLDLVKTVEADHGYRPL